MKLIEVRSVSKKYQEDFYALKNLSFSIDEASFTSVVGPFGCGKSTLLELLAGIKEEYSGTIKIRGQSPVHARLSRKIGYVFQRPTLLPWRNVLRNITLPQEISGIKDETKALNLLNIVGLREYALRMPYELSGGMQQLISIVRSLMLDPDILLLDEPFSSIDEINRAKMHVRLLDIQNKTNKTTLLVTHSLPEAVYLSDKIIVLTPSPARVKEVIDIHLPNRDKDVIFSNEFLDYVKRVKSALANNE